MQHLVSQQLNTNDLQGNNLTQAALAIMNDLKKKHAGPTATPIAPKETSLLQIAPKPAYPESIPPTPAQKPTDPAEKANPKSDPQRLLRLS
jgi:hypothetical protein